MKTEENDPLWRLLGEAKRPTVSAFFSRNVLREIRESKQEKAGVLAWLRRSGALAFVTGAAAVVLTFAGIWIRERPQGARSAANQQPGEEVLLAQQFAKNPDSDAIKNLDELLASDDNSIWLDNSAY